MGINLGEKLPVQNKTRSPLSFSLNSNKTENGKGRDLRDSRWTATKQNEKLSIRLGPKQSVAHCEPNLSPLSTSPCNLEAGKCSNTLLGPLSSTFNPDEIGENPSLYNWFSDTGGYVEER